ncbi:MAG: methyl-accepting chemotaxis protein [Candidatus Acidiferrales bacterium]|jgi:methyl-accepting chemotaxis protein WspA
MLNKLTIKARLIFLIGLMSLVGLAVGVVGLIQSSSGERAFDRIFTDRVLSIGYLKNVELAYTVQIIGAANKYSDGVLSAQDALDAVKTATSQIEKTWPRFVSLQRGDADKQMAGETETLMKGADTEVATLTGMLQRGDKAGIRKFIASNWYAVSDPLSDQLNLLYQTLQSEARNDFQDLTASYGRGRTIQLAILIIGLAASIFIGWTVLRTVTHSLGNVRRQLHEIAEGEGDLTKRLATSDDEVGMIAAEVNALMEKLLLLIKRVQESGIQVTSSATQLTASSKELEATLTQQVASTNEVVSSAKEIAATTQTLVGTMADVSVLSQQAATSAGSGQTGLQRMGTTMEKMATASTAIAEKLADINAKVTNITSVVTTINKVADQTNLLSLNAAIEAAKAGEFGQGFAVVAREIRRLADQTAIATLDIEQMVKEMQSSVSSGVMGMEKFAQEVQSAVREVNDISGQIARIIEQVQGLGPRFESVNEGMESQSVGARQITEAMIQLSEATRNTAETQRDAVRAIELLDQAARVLHREVSRFNVNTPTSSSSVPQDLIGELAAVG